MIMREPRINDDKLLSFADHELYMAFDNDDDAIMFAQWLHTEGWGSFVVWAEAHAHLRD